MDIKEALLLLLKDAGLTNIYSVKGKVTKGSVNLEKRTCEVEPNNDEANYKDVKLQSPESGGTGVLFIPKEESDVIVHFLDEDEAYVTKTSKVSKVEIITEGGEILLNGEKLGGLIKINELKTQINKNTQILNVIQSVFSAWVVASGDGGAVLKTASSTFINLQRADLSNIENEMVKHG